MAEEDPEVPHRDPVAEALMSDGMERLWTPHRMEYIQGEGKPPNDEAGDECPFCRVPGLDDAEGLIVARGATAYAVLNLYPYNTGHLLVCTYRHVADYIDLTSVEAAELASLVQKSIVALRRAMAPDGFNIGMNQGPISGAGIAAHLHQHVIPRWLGDSNFMPLVARTKVLPQDLPETRRRLADCWD
ncbi:MAG: HIT domain-containing protein [Candidatus Nanopelagicales bacterium]|nr:HIT domain-containing protein [Candidatus Nanopelagicales bacterium]MDZ4250706.1 HIT domain-containing protein [Candidatus Nanopelagicales bacterium]